MTKKNKKDLNTKEISYTNTTLNNIIKHETYLVKDAKHY